MLSCRLATFYSRSRKERWCKGETSGNFISVKGVYLDCDRDSVVYLGDPCGPSCHTVSSMLVSSEFKSYLQPILGLEAFLQTLQELSEPVLYVQKLLRCIN